jgi:hypothetical protein
LVCQLLNTDGFTYRVKNFFTRLLVKLPAFYKHSFYNIMPTTQVGQKLF